MNSIAAFFIVLALCVVFAALVSLTDLALKILVSRHYHRGRSAAAPFLKPSNSKRL